MREPPRLREPLKQLSQLPPPNPYQKEVDTTPLAPVDTRPRLVKPIEHVLVPKFNQLYDSLRSTQGWRYMADGLASGTISTTVNTTVTTPVNLSKSPNWRLEQWPGGVQVYLAVRFFGIAPQTIPTANAGIEVLFIDQFGNIAPLGEFLGATGGNSSYDTILPTPITDPGNTNVGTLSVSLANVATSNAVYNWSIGFSAVYLLPARYGYEMIEDQEWTDTQHKDKHHDR